MSSNLAMKNSRISDAKMKFLERRNNYFQRKMASIS
jgi:hypothetical protein